MYYKTLCKNNKGSYSNFNFTKYLPVKNEDGTWTPGKWLPKRKVLEICAKGYHYTDKNHLVDWLNEQIFEVEISGEKLDSDNKSCCQSMRFIRKIETWNEKSARLFVCWCVRQIWHLLDNEQSKNAVIVAEKYANGEATQDELAAARAAAWAAARAASWEAARDAARNATWAAERDAARNATWSAAWAAAWAAERDAARNATWAAARDVQSKHLIEILGLEE